MPRHISAVTILALAGLTIAASPAGAQDEVRDWDDVSNPSYDTSETDEANRQISESDAEYQRLEGEIARVEEQVGPLSGADQISSLEQDMDAAESDVLSGIDDLLAARVEAVQEAEVSGSPAEREDALDNKLAALRDVESYAEEWDTEASSLASVRGEVEAEKEAAEEAQDRAESPDETTTSGTTIAPPAEDVGQDQPRDGGQREPQASPVGDAQPTGGLRDTLKTGAIGAGIALAAAGIVALVARTRHPRPTQGNVAPRQAEDYDPDTPTVGGQDE